MVVSNQFGNLTNISNKNQFCRQINLSDEKTLKNTIYNHVSNWTDINDKIN